MVWYAERRRAARARRGLHYITVIIKLQKYIITVKYYRNHVKHCAEQRRAARARRGLKTLCGAVARRSALVEAEDNAAYDTCIHAAARSAHPRAHTQSPLHPPAPALARPRKRALAPAPARAGATGPATRDSCWGHADSCWGHADSCWGHADSCWGHADSCWGHADSC